ncbi:septum formation family protein [Saccharopolyspora halophila]|uniref:Septum formation family protein n=2 Tax=Saccharopolyspora halophila TaxID=405551 RepID=A0ABN3FMZ0_9PSEU
MMCSMPSSTRSSRRKRRNTTIVMVAAAVGALAILVASLLLNWPTSDSDNAGSGSGTFGSAPAPDVAFEAKAGECLTWSESDASDIRKVTCAEPHLFEVTGPFDLKAEFPPQAPYPSAEHWQRLKEERCIEVTDQYLQGEFDPNGRFSIGAFTPSKENWEDGDRTLHCGLQQPGPSGKLYPVEGAAGEMDQSNVYPAGRCLGISGSQVWDPVACSQQHAVEISAVVNLSEEFTEGYPSEDDQDTFLATKCEELTAGYAGGPEVAEDKGLIVFWDTMPEESWNVGSRLVNCKLGVPLPDGSGLAPVTGSVKNQVKIGKQPAGERTTPTQPGAPATRPR